MALTSIFAKKAEPAVARAAHEALTKHLAAITALQGERDVIAEKARLARVHIDTAGQHEASIARAQAAIDAKLGDARYADLPAPDLTAERKVLADLQNRSAAVMELGRVARTMQPRIEADLKAHATKAENMRLAMQRLLWDAALEVVGNYGPELLEAEAKLKAVHRKAFVAALAADSIAMTARFGGFVGSERYHELKITKPDMPAFWPTVMSPYGAQVAREEDLRAIQNEANRLIHVLLNSEE
jgi:hypothetical protein